MLAPDSAMLIGSAPGGKAEVSPLRGELHIPGVTAPPAHQARKKDTAHDKPTGTNEAAKPPDSETPLMPMPDWRPPPSSPWQDLLAPKAPACNLTCGPCGRLDAVACQCAPLPQMYCIADSYWDSNSCQCVPIPPCPAAAPGCDWPIPIDLIEPPVISPSAP
jgi:hypothetical protein